jgi:hypothetical protein
LRRLGGRGPIQQRLVGIREIKVKTLKRGILTCAIDRVIKVSNGQYRFLSD